MIIEKMHQQPGSVLNIPGVAVFMAVFLYIFYFAFEASSPAGGVALMVFVVLFLVIFALIYQHKSAKEERFYKIKNGLDVIKQSIFEIEQNRESASSYYAIMRSLEEIELYSSFDSYSAVELLIYYTPFSYMFGEDAGKKCACFCARFDCERGCCNYIVPATADDEEDKPPAPETSDDFSPADDARSPNAEGIREKTRATDLQDYLRKFCRKYRHAHAIHQVKEVCVFIEKFICSASI